MKTVLSRVVFVFLLALGVSAGVLVTDRIFRAAAYVIESDVHGAATVTSDIYGVIIAGLKILPRPWRWVALCAAALLPGLLFRVCFRGTKAALNSTTTGL